MSKVMSPGAPEQEVAGMKYAEKYFAERPNLPAAGCRLVGNVFFRKHSKKRESFAIGFERMAYIVSQERT